MIRRSAVNPGYAGFMFLRLAPLLSALGLALAAQAPQEVVSSARERTELGITIYHNNLAMIRDTRRFSLPAGRATLAFSDVAASMRPKSAWMTFKGSSNTVLERNFEFDLLSPASLVDRSLGQPVAFPAEGQPGLIWGELASLPLRKPRWAPWRTPLQRIARIGPVLQAADTSVLVRSDDKHPSAIPEAALVFRKIPSQLRPTPTLLADVLLNETSATELELAYTADKVNWEATYLARLSPSGRTMDLDGFVTLTNNSGMDFPKTSLQLVAGEPNQVNDPPMRDPDESKVDLATVECAAAMAPGFKQESLSDYLLLTLDRPTDLKNGQTKQVKLFSAAGIPVSRTFVFIWSPELRWLEPPTSRAHAPSPWVQGSDTLQVWAMRSQSPNADAHEYESWPLWIRDLTYPEEIPFMAPVVEMPNLLLEFQNDAASKLGRPLPKGTFWIHAGTQGGGAFPLGGTELEATPPGEQALLVLPPEWLGKGVHGQHAWRAMAWREEGMEWEGESTLSNDRNEPVHILLRLSLPQGSELRDHPADSSMFEPGTFDFRLTLAPHDHKALHLRAFVPKQGLPFSY